MRKFVSKLRKIRYLIILPSLFFISSCKSNKKNKKNEFIKIKQTRKKTEVQQFPIQQSGFKPIFSQNTKANKSIIPGSNVEQNFGNGVINPKTALQTINQQKKLVVQNVNSNDQVKSTQQTQETNTFNNKSKKKLRINKAFKSINKVKTNEIIVNNNTSQNQNLSKYNFNDLNNINNEKEIDLIPLVKQIYDLLVSKDIIKLSNQMFSFTLSKKLPLAGLIGNEISQIIAFLVLQDPTIFNKILKNPFDIFKLIYPFICPKEREKFFEELEKATTFIHQNEAFSKNPLKFIQDNPNLILQALKNIFQGPLKNSQSLMFLNMCNNQEKYLEKLDINLIYELLLILKPYEKSIERYIQVINLLRNEVKLPQQNIRLSKIKELIQAQKVSNDIKDPILSKIKNRLIIQNGKYGSDEWLSILGNSICGAVSLLENLLISGADLPDEKIVEFFDDYFRMPNIVLHPEDKISEILTGIDFQTLKEQNEELALFIEFSKDEIVKFINHKITTFFGLLPNGIEELASKYGFKINIQRFENFEDLDKAILNDNKIKTVLFYLNNEIHYCNVLGKQEKYVISDPDGVIYPFTQNELENLMTMDKSRIKGAIKNNLLKVIGDKMTDLCKFLSLFNTNVDQEELFRRFTKVVYEIFCESMHNKKYTMMSL